MLSNGPPVRVAFALGSWQIVALAAALDEADAATAPAAAPPSDVLVLYETGPVSTGLVEAMHAVAAAAHPWSAVVEAFDTMPAVRRDLSQGDYDALRSALRTRVGAERVDELWLCRAHRAAERLAIECWPEAKIVLYEDGILSYLPLPPLAREPSIGLGRRWRDALERRRPARRLRRWKDAIDPRHATRIASAWMLLGDVFPAPKTLAHVPWHAVRGETLRAVIERCRSIPAVAAFAAAPGSGRPAVLVLGQALSRFHALPRQAELAVYAGAVARIVAQGYDVWWKEHPRATEPFFAELEAAVPAHRLRELALPFALPVELVADRLGLAACAGGITTALFYLPRLLGIAAYSFADGFAGKLRGDWALQNDVFLQRVPRLAELPAAGAAAS